jgi:DHA2 family multidrug resistance protein
MTEIEGGLSRIVIDYWRLGLASRRSLPEAFLWALQVDLGWYVGFWLLAVAGAAASAVTTERERDTWVSLTATPLSGGEILRGKVLGAIWNQRGFAAVLVFLWVLGLTTGAVHPLGVLASIAVVGLLTWLVAMVEIYTSLRAASTSRALTSSLAILAVLNGYPLILLFWFIGAIPWWSSYPVLGALPSLSAWSMFSTKSLDEAWKVATTPGGPAAIGVILTGIVLGVVFIYAGTALALTWRVVGEFDRWLDRPPLQKTAAPRLSQPVRSRRQQHDDGATHLPRCLDPATEPWIIAVAVTIATSMEVLDTSIANVALRYIAGGLSAAESDSEWIITSYLAANASVLLLSGWLSAYFGRRNYYLASLLIFTVSSAACGFSRSLEELIFFRILQGLGGGGLQPVTQAVLVDTFPPEKQGAAQALFGISALVAPVLGPTLGGYIADNYSWEWIFFINIPPGLLALAVNYAVLRDPDYLQAERAEMRSKPLRFDCVGLGLIVLSIACMEILLSKGQEWDWLGDPFGRVQLLMLGLGLGFAMLIYWELGHSAPILNLRPFLDRNFAASGLIAYLAFAITYASMVLLPGMLQTLSGYNAVWSGLVMSPASLFSIPTMALVGYLIGKKIDARWIIVFGAVLMWAGAFWYSQMNLEVSPAQLVWPRVLQQVGTASLFAPLSVAAFNYLPKELRGPAAGIFAALRNEGGSAGTAMGNTLVTRRIPVHTDRLVEHLNPFYPVFNDAIRSLRSFFFQVTGDPVGSRTMALQAIDDMRQQQSASMAYLDAFWLFAMLSLALIPLAFLMRRSVAEEGMHIGAE